MKSLAILFSLAFFTFNFGQDLKGYTVVLKRTSTSVAEGMCTIYGTVKIMGEDILFGGQIVTNDYEYKAPVQADGSYSITIPSTIKNLYFVSNNMFEVSVLDYDFESKHKVKINFHSSLRPIQMEMTEKPVIYLYSNDTTDVNVKINPTGDISFSYPSYKNGWNVKSTYSGKVIQNDKAYPYLFWEGEHKDVGFTLNNTKSGLEGYYIQTDTCISFLENTLSYLGLNDTESTDFITYWGPRLQKKPFAFIQFKELEAYASEIASIQVTPQPNSIQRVFMVFEGLNSAEVLSNVTIVEPHLSPFNRWGFSLIEWGGSEVNQLSHTLPINL